MFQELIELVVQPQGGPDSCRSRWANIATRISPCCTEPGQAEDAPADQRATSARFALDPGQHHHHQDTIRQADWMIYLHRTKNGSGRYIRLKIIWPWLLWVVRCVTGEGRIEDVTWHFLRHTFASWLIMHSVNLRTGAIADGAQVHLDGGALFSSSDASQARGGGVDCSTMGKICSNQRTRVFRSVSCCI